MTTIGMIAARMLGLSRLRVYENGVVSLNLPMCTHILGSRATRTTHPRNLANLSRLFTLVDEAPFRIENPFHWKTKTEILRGIAAANCAPIIAATVSCAQFWRQTSQHPHCGRCSQCLDRRFAVLAAGVEEHDPESNYEIPLFTGSREPGADRKTAVGYIQQAQGFARMDARAFLERFGELDRVFSAQLGPPEELAKNTHALCYRHGVQVVEALARGVAQHAGEMSRGQIDAGCILSWLGDPGPESDPLESTDLPPKSDDSPPVLQNRMWRCRGNGWEIRFAEGESAIYLARRGFEFLALLLSAPDRDHTCSELLCEISQGRLGHPLEKAEAINDSVALQAYALEYEELQAELDEAKGNHDIARVESAQAKIAHLATFLADQTHQKPHSQDRERMRKLVAAALNRCINEIRVYDSALAIHLDQSLVRGWRVKYAPATTTLWSVRRSAPISRQPPPLGDSTST